MAIAQGTMDLEGSVRVTVEWDGCRIRGVRVASSRSDVAQALVGGRRADDAEGLLPRIFSICARAQTAAAAAALDAARGTESRNVRCHQMAVLAEVALEYLWRLQIDLPGLLGLPQRPATLVRLRREFGRERDATRDWPRFVHELRAAIEEESTGERVDQAEPPAFADWEAASDAPAARLLRTLRAVPLARGETAPLPRVTEMLLRKIDDALEHDPAFSQRPLQDGAPAECGARARLVEHPLLQALGACTSRPYQRILARWLELAAIPERLSRLLNGETALPCVRSLALAPGRGIAGVETARGLLVHAVELAGERVARYRIVAPTEWNFHPEGALPEDLVDVRASKQREVEQRAALAVQSLDPCVRYALEVERRDA